MNRYDLNKYSNKFVRNRYDSVGDAAALQKAREQKNIAKVVESGNKVVDSSGRQVGGPPIPLLVLGAVALGLVIKKFVLKK